MATVLRHFHRRGKPTALICHGPIALVSTVQDPAVFLRAVESGDTRAATQHVVKDRELITGQNPTSDAHLADALLSELDAGKPRPKWPRARVRKGGVNGIRRLAPPRGPAR